MKGRNKSWKRLKIGDLQKNQEILENKGASSNGGFALRDAVLVSKLRSAGWEAIKRIGKQLLSGKFNLISIAFPYK